MHSFKYKEILKDLKGTNILVIGDIMLDRYIIGTVERISPEAPVPIVFVKEEDYTLGGAGNVVANLCQLNVNNVHLFCRIGADTFGGMIKEELEALNYKYGNVETTYYTVDQSTVKTRIMADNHQIVRFDRENPFPMTSVATDDLLSKLDKEIREMYIDAILISDYGKGTITPNLLATLHSKYAEDIPICIDPSPKTDYPLMPEAFILPNTTEKEKMQLHVTDRFKAVVETAGADGIYIYHKGETDHIEAVEVSDVVDTVGAGDTVTAVFAAAYGTGATLHNAAKLANIAASVVVRHAMTYAISYVELLNAI